MAKNLILGLIYTPWAQIRAPIFFYFFFKNVASSVPRYHDQLSSCTTSEKTKDPNFSDRRTDEQTDG